MSSVRYLMIVVMAEWAMPCAGQAAGSGYVGSAACGRCHAPQSESQSKTAHARALRPARVTDPGPGRGAQWAFGAGMQATTWVTQTGPDSISEHGLTYYAATKSLALTPGHSTSADRVYRTFDPVATALLCFRCHSTGPVSLATDSRVEPNEAGVHCEACHGPGRAHAESGGAAAIQNPKRLTAAQINTLCGACHRQASDVDDETDWSNSWNVRHESAYLHRAACFRNSNGALSCLTCHSPHQPLRTAAASYDAKCVSCHAKAVHTNPIASRSCVGCHMPRVAVGANLKFTNHWIGIYDPAGRKLIPSRRAVASLHPVPAQEGSQAGVLVPADPATLAPLYARHVSESGNVARAESDFGLFLLKIGKSEDAEAPLRRAVESDAHHADPAIDGDRESLGLVLQAEGKSEEALELFREAAAGEDPRVAARAYAKLGELDPPHADLYYRNALTAEERASGPNGVRVAVLLREEALALRAHNRDSEAEPLLRRALAIQKAASKPDPRVTIEVLNTLGNLLEGRRRLDEAENLEREAMKLSEEKLGPESAQLAMTCTNLADVLWNKKNLREAGLLYRRAIGIDTSLFGPDRPETAADLANLGMLMQDAGQSASGAALLRNALAIYEKTLGAGSDQARFVKAQLAR